MKKYCQCLNVQETFLLETKVVFPVLAVCSSVLETSNSKQKKKKNVHWINIKVRTKLWTY